MTQQESMAQLLREAEADEQLRLRQYHCDGPHYYHMPFNYLFEKAEVDSPCTLCGLEMQADIHVQANPFYGCLRATKG